MTDRNFDALNIEEEVIIDPDISYWLGGALEMDEPEEDIFFYHKDQLGSSTQISDLSAAIIHHIEYMTFGENYFEMKSTWETPYKFNGKEKDEETGMYYYGARYYIPELSIWGSVDPLSDKYPSMSAFMYCAGNPVVLVDPDGRDITDYGVKSNGEVVRIGPIDNNSDRLYAINDDGSKKSENHIVIPKGSVSLLKSGEYKYLDPNTKQTKTKPAYGVFVKGDMNAQNIFEFLSSNSNNEYAKTSIFNMTGKNGSNVISTSYEEGQEGGSSVVKSFCLKNNILIRGYDHNHPNGDPLPSGMGSIPGDIQFVKGIESQNPEAFFRIFTPNNKIKYNYFNSTGPIMTPFNAISK